VDSISTSATIFLWIKKSLKKEWEAKNKLEKENKYIESCRNEYYNRLKAFKIEEDTKLMKCLGKRAKRWTKGRRNLFNKFCRVLYIKYER
jgi:hypothetical protein